MRLLLDTHTFLWWVADWGQIAESAREVISDPNNEVFVSVVRAGKSTSRKPRTGSRLRTIWRPS